MTHDERLGPPPIEPLSDTAWSRIERGVWSELDAAAPERPARAARRWWLAGGVLAAAAAIVALVLGLRAGSGPLAVVDEPSRVVSGTAPSAVSFGDAHITMDAEPALVLSREADHPVVLIERGAAWFTVAPRAGRPAFIVRAGDASVRVVGTRFRVARSEEQIAVAVEHGAVDVQFRGAVTAVGARQHWSSTSPAHATEIASALGPALPGAPRAAPPAPPAPPAPAPDPVPAPAPAVDPDPAPARVAPARSHRPRPAPSPATAPAPAPAAAPAKPASLVDADRAEYDRLAALEPVHPEAALDGYLALARGSGSWADPALFAAARLAADRGDRRAASLLGSYLQRSPAGANAADARRLLARLKGTP
jgi:hypothetical protein